MKQLKLLLIVIKYEKEIKNNEQLEQDYLDEIAQHIMKERGSTKMTIDQAKPRESFQSSSI